MTIKTRSLRQTLLIGASLGSLIVAAAARADGGRISAGRGVANPADAAVRSAQDQAARAAQASSATERAIASFQHAAATRNAMAEAQRVARAAAMAAQSNVPNGLGAGGLQTAAGVVFGADGKPITVDADGKVTSGNLLWVGASGPASSRDASGRTAVSIDQTQSKAILTWDSFNVGRETDLAFRQGGSDWAVLNRVTDASADPTRILGTIKAPGTVLIMNRNGVIFGGSSQVNVRNLVAAAANISNSQFLTNGIYGAAGQPAFTAALGKVRVDAGAQITTAPPTSVTSGGGYVMLLGTEVTNAGSITTPKGQTLLSAGDNFLVRQGFGTTGNPYSTTRGNEVLGLIEAGSSSGVVTNSGQIEATQGDITLGGRTIRQDGVMVATTSVNQRGTIHLLNSAADSAGSITLGKNSLTAILPELDTKDTALDSQRDQFIKDSDTANDKRTITGGFDDRSTLADRLDQSRVEIVTGGNVLFEGGSQTRAQGGQVAVQASAGRITAADGALIDVSGVQGVALDMGSNAIKVNVQGNELRDSPVNRDNPGLRNTDVWIDISSLVYVPAGTGGYAGDRWYTPGGLLEVGGYLANQPHTIGEWTAVGGTITLAAKELVAQKGATFDISGGSLDYAAGYIRSTRVLGDDGKLYDISNAPAYLKMVGYGDMFQRKHDRWGEAYTQIYSHPLFSARDSGRWHDGYTVGRDAGRLTLSAPTITFDADIAAGTINGSHQTVKRVDGVTDGYKTGQTTVARSGTLAVQASGLYDNHLVPMAVDTKLVFGTAAPPAARTGTAWFDTSVLNAMELGGIVAWTKQSIAVTDALTLAPGGRIDFAAPRVDVSGTITARGGSVSLGNLAGYMPLLDANGAASVVVAGGGAIDTRGLWTNLLTDPAADPARLAFVKGGAVSLKLTGGGNINPIPTTSGAVTLAKGSRVDASAGGAMLAEGRSVGGNGGDITLATYDTRDTIHGGSSGPAALILDGILASYGFGKGGRLALIAGTSVMIGKGKDASAAPTGLTIDPALLSSGFSAYTVQTQRDLTVADGTRIDATMPAYQFSAAATGVPTGSEIGRVAEVVLLPQVIENPVGSVLTQRGGASLTLIGDNVTIGAGADVTVDLGQSIRLAALRRIIVDGGLTAHGGTIALLSDLNNLPGADRILWIGGNARLDVSGVAASSVDALGRRYGFAQAGGNLLIGLESTTSIRDGLGNQTMLKPIAAPVVIRPGAQLLADGATTTIDTGATGGRTSTTLAGAGGLIRIGSLKGIYNDGMMSARAGAAGAAGGTLNLVREPVLIPSFDGVTFEPTPAVITITQQRVASGLASGTTANDLGALPAESVRISVAEIEAGGFGNLDLYARDAFVFDGSVSLHMAQGLALHRGQITPGAAATAAASVDLSAPYVLLDGAAGIKDLLNPVYQLPEKDFGRIAISGAMIDVANGVSFGGQTFLNGRPRVALPGFDTVVLNSSGDIRFAGSRYLRDGQDPANPASYVSVPASLNSGAKAFTITASQLYPVSGGAGAIQLGPTKVNGQGDETHRVLTINGLGDRPAVPFSVFGSLSLFAPIIRQNGILRAPLGSITLTGGVQYSYFDPVAQRAISGVTSNVVELGAGSITSVSAGGLTMPYGGTIDGLSWTYDGQKTLFFDSMVASSGVTIGGTKTTVAEGALIDLSGGGTLTGAGFVTGRGGSVDILKTGLVNANPANGGSASAQVYALVPGSTASYTPEATTADAGSPAIGQQITLDGAVGALPAGTYTLMPSSYALLPGAYRIELGTSAPVAIAPVQLASGSWQASGTLAVADTNVRDALPTLVTITPGKVLRTYSNYNETSYSQFVIANAAAFNAVTPRLERDASNLTLRAAGLDFRGKADFAAAKDGRPGALLLNASEVRAAGSAATTSDSITDTQLAAINAPILVIGGGYGLVNVRDDFAVGPKDFGPQVVFDATTDALVVRQGAVLRAGQVFLQARKGVTVEAGAIIDTRQSSATLIDAAQGYLLSVGNGGSKVRASGAVLAVGNGQIDFLNAKPGTDVSTIMIDDGVSLLTKGSVTLASSGGQDVGDVNLEAHNLSLSGTVINIGDRADIAAGAAGDGIVLSQALIGRLLGAATPIERVSLAASQSINFYGNATLDLVGKIGTTPTLVVTTPALYGWGGSGDTARIAADTVIWSGVVGSGTGVPGSPFVSARPGAVVPGGAGTGSGALVIDARRIEFGYAPRARTQGQTALDRLVLGFSGVTLNASERITANNRNTLSVYAGGSDPSAGFDPRTYAGTGGALTLVTPLLTGNAGSAMTYRTSGALTIAAPLSGPAATAPVTTLGGEVQLFGDTVAIDTAVALPSGRLSATGANGIAIGSKGVLDLSGRTVPLFDVVRYSWGGDVVLETANGAITQSGGSKIDVSATNAAAGSIKATATGNGGAAIFAGTLAGTGGTDATSGGIDLRVSRLDDFAGFNRKLNDAGFVGARGFVIKTGDLTISDELRAHSISVSADGGSLTVTGRIDASGRSVGRISLAARDDLAVAPGAVLDAHGSVLAVDGRGAPVAADNRGRIELTARRGTLRLGNATFDLSTPAATYGEVVMNAPRISETGGDIAIEAGGAPIFKGVDRATLNAVWTYLLPDGSVIDQKLLDGYDAANGRFVDAALGNGGLQTRLTGLRALGDRFHLRPGVEIASAGSLSTSGDLDLSGYRYGPNADRDIGSAFYGAGEPIALTIRAAGTLTLNGSVSDGFKGTAGIPGTPDSYDGILDIPTAFDSTYQAYGRDIYSSSDYSTDYYFAADWVVPDTELYRDSFGGGPNGNYAIGDVVPAGTKFKLGEISLDSGGPLPTIGTTFVPGTPGVPGRSGASPFATMQAAGTSSASIRLVAGADTGSADARTLAAATALRAAGRGDLLLNAPVVKEGASPLEMLEVAHTIRTGTGSLDLLAGGDFRQTSLYGIYTAGDQISGTDAYNKTASDSDRMYFIDRGGDLTLIAQGDLRSYTTNNIVTGGGQVAITPSNGFDWLKRQGDATSGEATAWGVSFGRFTGIGTLGGGTTRITVGGDAGSTSNWSPRIDGGGRPPASDDSFNIVVASSGYVADGTLRQFGGGALSLKVGGRINAGLYSVGDDADFVEGGTGVVANMRGDTAIDAASIGQLLTSGYGLRNGGVTTKPFDPRAPEVGLPRDRGFFTPLRLVTGDGTFALRIRGYAGIVTGSDAGRIANGSAEATTSGFTLWSDRTGYSIFSAGGSIGQLPRMDPGVTADAAGSGRDLPADPGRFVAMAPSGSISVQVSLAPARTGSLELLAGDSLFGAAVMSSDDPNGFATPFNPVTGTADTNFGLFASNNPIPTALHAGDADPIRAYAVGGDAMVQIGAITLSNPFDPLSTVLPMVAKPLVMRAGRDILTNAYVMNNAPTDISVIAAGRDILNSTVNIWGPGLLDVSAGRNIYMSDRGSVTSNGAIVTGDTRPGASLAIAAGLGANGPDYSRFADLYFDPANQLGMVNGQLPPLEGSGKVAKTYEKELIAWLADTLGYQSAGAADALTHFKTLTPERQAIFIRQVYFAELRAGGREYNNNDSTRFGSYLRGRAAIATLFPTSRTYGGSITMFATETPGNGGTIVRTGGGVRTLFGGDIQMLTPGGQQVIGVDGVVPSASSGIVTQGSGNISLYSQKSILLGLSRIMTTFGGSILGWSANGDINAGRGAKTTLVYTPPKRVYDVYGNVTLSPVAPSSGAGIATLNPIPEVAPGDIDLIAPLGTIDAGEAGIRVSGNINLAALQVLNAANIQVQGKASGIPAAVAVNTGALTAASSAASAVTAEATRVAERTRPAPMRDIPGIITVTFAGFGEP